MSIRTHLKSLNSFSIGSTRSLPMSSAKRIKNSAYVKRSFKNITSRQQLEHICRDKDTSFHLYHQSSQNSGLPAHKSQASKDMVRE